MHVDAAELRAVADRLRDQAGDPLARAGGLIERAGSGVVIDTLFDDYVTAGPYREVAASWQGELRVLREAIAALSDALTRAADDYDAADERAAAGMPR
ncbi:hypothetical protein [Winogradskya humida]|uniref:Excreted virulence factor EspC (Type VII ESX diderm) n=1 Tax=Winogradskya humida TaxID=113566 RepID=A0ABQ3ZVR8_9ACTN|nr:hypothetical protein [Actinoplanes humidus]GIE22638.1 hypothetical protein Ahu01nite_057400 [Actinoplanes humidus]